MNTFHLLLKSKTTVILDVDFSTAFSEDKTLQHFLFLLQTPYDPVFSSWLEDLQIFPMAEQTLLISPPIDQSALHGYLLRFRDLLLPIGLVCAISNQNAADLASCCELENG